MLELSRQSRSRFVWLVAGFVVLAASASPAVQAPPPPRVTVTGPVGAVVVNPEVSPDGQMVAFTAFARGPDQVWKGRVYIGSVSQVEAEPLLGIENQHWSSGGFSPDGQFLLITENQPPHIAS